MLGCGMQSSEIEIFWLKFHGSWHLHWYTTTFWRNNQRFEPAHLYQISMDGPNVNLKFYQEFVQKRKDENYHSLIDIGSCGLHVIHGSLGTGVDDSQWALKKLMKGAYQLFHDIPALRDDYESITGSTTYPFSYCSNR